MVKPSDVLREAKKYLWDGHKAYSTPFVCHAIAKAGNVLRARRISDSLREQIMKALYPTHSLKSWLIEKHEIEPWRHSPWVMQDYRRRYLDYLITEFEKAGQ